MATYKVIQDIEAEDKLIGPLTLRQFIYAAIACVALYLSFISITKHFAFMIVFLLPVAVTAGFFAFPWKSEQPTEIWALARIRFLLKPRKRVWDQSGAKELVTITAPKHIQIDYTNGLSQIEVRSRLRALADTIDSRGWAIKNTNVNMYGQPALVMAEPTSDRLLGPSALPQEVSGLDIQAADDMLDETNNPVAQQVGNMIEASAKAHREKIMESLRQPGDPQSDEILSKPQPTNNYWFLNQAGQSASVPNNQVTFNTQVVTPGTPAEETPGPSAVAVTPDENEEELVHVLEARKQELPMAAYYGHLHTIQPLSAQKASPKNSTAAPPPDTNQPPAVPAATSSQKTDDNQPPAQSAPVAAQPPQPVTPTQQAAILQLANNDDLNVATIAREAQRSGLSEGEVVIKLH